MSLYKDASLVMIPSAYKDGKLYSIRPTDGSGDFTFSRGSNLAATRVDVNGLIEKGRENLLLQSNTFDATWSSVNSSITSNQSGYDGSLDAWLLSQNGGAGYVEQAISQSGVYTLSVYAKAGSYDWLRLRINTTGTTHNGYYDLSNGTIGGSGVGVDKTIESVGGGWYKCTITSVTPSTSIRVYPALSDGDISGTSGSIYIQDAQLEAGLVATDYIETGASTAQAGILEDMPRLDYSGGASCPALLLEPQRTNVVANSEYHSGSTYGNNTVTTTDNEAISPEGVQNAAKIVLDNGTYTSNGGHYYSFNSTAGTTYTISVFAKAGEYRYFTFTYGSSSAVGGHFDLQEGIKLGDITNVQYTNTSASIEDYGNGWYRLIVSLTDTNSVSGRYLSMKPSPSASVPSNNNYSSTGDGVSGAYIYGFQLEQGSYPTSYIPTYGASVTRSVDSSDSLAVTNDINLQNTSWTIFYEFETDYGVYQNSQRFINDQSGKLNVYTHNGGFRFYYRALSKYITSSSGEKVIARYDGSTLSEFHDGVECTYTDSQDGGSSYPFEIKLNPSHIGGVKQIVLFPTALTDSECIALTTL